MAFDKEAFEAKVGAFKDAAVAAEVAALRYQQLAEAVNEAGKTLNEAQALEDQAYDDLLAYVKAIDPTPSPAPAPADPPPAPATA